MGQPRTPREVFLELVQAVCERRVADLPGLYAIDTNVVHPFDPLRTPAMHSRDELRAHFEPLGDPTWSLQMQAAHIRVHEMRDPEVVVGEFEYHVTNAAGEQYVYPCIFVLRVRDGEIIESRDYVDHLTSAHAQGRLDAVFEAVRSRPINS